MDGKAQFIEDDTHKIAEAIQRMEALLKIYDNKPNQTNTRTPPEQDAKEIITLDVVYPIKNNDDTSFALVNVIEPVNKTKKQSDIVGEQLAEEALVNEPSVHDQLPQEKEHQVEKHLPLDTIAT